MTTNEISAPDSIYIEGVGTIRHQSSKKGRHAKNWYLRKNYMGKRITISLKTDNLEEAKKKAKKESNRIIEKYGRGEVIDGEAKRLKFEDLVEMIKADYDLRKNASKSKLEEVIRLHLSPSFAGFRALDITASRITAYAEYRHKEEGAALGTVHNELQNLKRMFTLANRLKGLNHHPAFPTIALDNARRGFFEEEEFQAVAQHLDEDVRSIAEFAYYTGWRKSEVVGLQWKQNVDMKAGIVRLDTGTTKNDKGRMFPFAFLTALQDLMENQREKADGIEKRTGNPVTHVFFRSDGRQVRSFKAAWKKAVEKAGLDGKIFHDFRRTAVRNLIRAGVSEHIAMQLTGHLTRSVFDRYDIVSEKDLAEAAAKLAKFHGMVQPQGEPPELVKEKKVSVSGSQGKVIAFPFPKVG